MSDTDFNIITKHDTVSNWTSSDPVLLKGQQGYETDSGRSKYGDGSSVWSSLPYATQINPTLLHAVLFAALPTPKAGSVLFIIDKGVAGKPAYADGTDWRFFNDDTIVT